MLIFRLIKICSIKISLYPNKVLMIVRKQLVLFWANSTDAGAPVIDLHLSISTFFFVFFIWFLFSLKFTISRCLS